MVLRDGWIYSNMTANSRAFRVTVLLQGIIVLWKDWESLNQRTQGSSQRLRRHLKTRIFSRRDQLYLLHHMLPENRQWLLFFPMMFIWRMSVTCVCVHITWARRFTNASFHCTWSGWMCQTAGRITLRPKELISDWHPIQVSKWNVYLLLTIWPSPRALAPQGHS